MGSLCAPGRHGVFGATNASTATCKLLYSLYSDSSRLRHFFALNEFYTFFLFNLGSPCPAGTYTSLMGQSLSSCSSAECPAGSICLGDGFVTPCTAGRYRATAGGASIHDCLPCSAGEFSKSGCSICSICPAGTYSHATAGNCTACAAGQYSFPASSQCLSCSS